MIKNVISTTPADLKLLLYVKISLTATTSDANIQNWVIKINGITISGLKAKNLSNPGEWAKPTAESIFLKFALVFFSGKIFTPII